MGLGMLIAALGALAQDAPVTLKSAARDAPGECAELIGHPGLSASSPSVGCTDVTLETLVSSLNQYKGWKAKAVRLSPDWKCSLNVILEPHDREQVFRMFRFWGLEAHQGSDGVLEVRTVARCENSAGELAAGTCEIEYLPTLGERLHCRGAPLRLIARTINRYSEWKLLVEGQRARELMLNSNMRMDPRGIVGPLQMNGLRVLLVNPQRRTITVGY